MMEPSVVIERVARMQEDIAEIKKALLSEEGLLIRVDRLEQAEQTRNKIIWALVTAIVPLGINAIWGLVR